LKGRIFLVSLKAAQRTTAVGIASLGGSARILSHCSYQIPPPDFPKFECGLQKSKDRE
jgi:hypothetical protein